ncbi:hypothetical protein A9798_08970 [Edwardsiella hoshinae]|uniref:Fimbrial, major and minor subunit n=1 Tax=Edwardsiella hoshinae TaxID=93378 RepID=A0ABM6EJF2_9GAMM|nr:hypothetical protein [Edwardsiella hoshinae]AOV97083.1 hypothetical protein A9798_08970 [Edwardsiella hoshinae]
MKGITGLLLAASLLPMGVLAWSTPGKDFSGTLTLGGPVTHTRNPWLWKIGGGSHELHAPRRAQWSRNGQQIIPVPLPALTLLLGKTRAPAPAGGVGLAPDVTYGKGIAGFSLQWTAPGQAEVVLPLTGDNRSHPGQLVFRIEAASLLRSQPAAPSATPTGGATTSSASHADAALNQALYNDLRGNGLPPAGAMLPREQTAAHLQAMFAGEGPAWLATLRLPGVAGLSQFRNTALHQVEGVYGARLVAGSGELRLNGAIPAHWQVSLPVSIDYP